MIEILVRGGGAPKFHKGAVNHLPRTRLIISATWLLCSLLIQGWSICHEAVRQRAGDRLDSRSRFVHRRYYWLHRRVHGRDGVGNGVNHVRRADCRYSIAAQLALIAAATSAACGTV
jgi:hypothetical protein